MKCLIQCQAVESRGNPSLVQKETGLVCLLRGNWGHREVQARGLPCGPREPGLQVARDLVM